MNELHLVYYVKNKILTFRISDGRTGVEPLFTETIPDCIERLKIQLGLLKSSTIERIY